MLSDRSYMRDDYPREGTSALAWLISSIVAVFVLQKLFAGPLASLDGVLENLLALTVTNIKAGKLWTLLTYSFLHSGLLHIIGNLLGIYFMGRALQPVLSTKRVMWVYGLAVGLGGLLWLGTHWQSGGMAIGASAGVLGLFTVFACFYPNQPMTFLMFFVLPVTLKPKYVLFTWLGIELMGYFFYEVWGAASPFDTPIAHSAHLGGMLAGWIYYRYLHEATWRFSGKADIELPRWFKKKAKTQPKGAPAYQVDLSRPNELRAEVDRILDKINSQGFGALTPEEKRLLDEAKDILSRR